MKKLASTLILALAVVFGSQSAMASTLDNKDLAFAFGAEGVDPGMLMLSEREMQETQGKVWPLAARFGWGAISGGISYTVTNWGTDNWDLRGLGQSAVYGGVGGLFGWNAGMSATFGAGSSAALNRWLDW